MRLTPIIVLCVCGMVPVGESVTAAQTSAERELTQLEEQWCAAEVNKDGTAYSALMADDYVGIGSRGTVETKTDALAALKTLGTTSCTNSNIKVRAYGTVGVVTGVATRSGTNNGVPYANRQVLYTDVWVRRNDRWQCVSSQGTLMASQQR